MPEFKERTSYEERISEAMKEVFREAVAVSAAGLEAMNVAIKKALRKYVGPIMEEVHRRVIILLLLLFGDDDRAASVIGDAPKEEGPMWDTLARQARRRSRRQVDRLGDQMADTNRAWWEERDEDVDPETFAVDRLFPDSRADSVAITETTSAVTIGERTVIDEMKKLGVGVKVKWYTKLDERVCPVCGPLHGTGPSKWLADFKQGPPAHVRCRCYLLYSL
jgi:hypothetical protein